MLRKELDDATRVKSEQPTSKDFFDPVGNGGQGRRINWGWATVPPASTQTMPREVTWNPELQQLVFSPLPEQDALRGAVLADVTDPKPIAAGDVVTLMPKADAGNCSEVEVNFEIPSAAARVGVVRVRAAAALPPAALRGAAGDCAVLAAHAVRRFFGVQPGGGGGCGFLWKYLQKPSA